MSKLSRRAFIATGLVAGGGLVVGIAMRPGNQAKSLAAKLGPDGKDLVHTYVKIDSNNVVTAVIPHSEMGQGVPAGQHAHLMGRPQGDTLANFLILFLHYFPPPCENLVSHIKSEAPLHVYI